MYPGIPLPWWGYVAVTLVFTHITIAAVTIYLHRHSAHRALDLHPVVSHFFRLWLWLTTGMHTKQWTAIHRKHHNNHHAYPTSARLSSKWWEFDIGWLYIRALALFGLATVKKVAPKVRLVPTKVQCDEDTLHAVVTSRYDVLTRYGSTLKSACKDEFGQLRGRVTGVDWRLFKRWLHGEEQEMSPRDRERLAAALRVSETLRTVHSMRHDLTALWQRSGSTNEQLVRQLEDWCQRAEMSGIAALRNFSRNLRRYQLYGREERVGSE